MDYPYDVWGYVVRWGPGTGDQYMTPATDLGRRNVEVIDAYYERPFVGLP
jgi:hypothetical protein